MRSPYLVALTVAFSISPLVGASPRVGVSTSVPGASAAAQSDGVLWALGSWQGEGRSAESIAAAWLEGPGAAFKGAAALHAQRTRVSPLGAHVTYQQVEAGQPVLDGWVRVSVSPSGRVIGAWSSVVDAHTSPVRLSAEQAKALASEALAAVESALSPARVTLGATPMGSVYRVEIPAVEPQGVWRLHVSATTGQVLGEIEDVAAYRDGVATVFYVSPSVALETNTLSDGADRARAVPAEAYVEVALEDLAETGYLVGPYVDTRQLTPKLWAPFSETGEFHYNRQDNAFEAVQAYWALDYAQRHIQALGFDDVNNRQLKVSVGTYPADNSFYSAGTITLGSGGVDDGEDTEVVWHEMGHSIHADQVPGWGTSHEARSMGEGFGDFIAASLGSDFSGGFQDACVAEWDAISYSSSNPPCLRRTDSDKIYPDDMSNSSVHADGEIWSSALWDQRAHLGNDETLAIVLASHFLLAPSATMEQAATAFQVAASQLGVTPIELQRIQAVFVEHGLM